MAFCTRCWTGTWETPTGQSRAQKTSLAFLKQQQRAPYFLRFLPSESDLWHDTSHLHPAVSSNRRTHGRLWDISGRHCLYLFHTQLFFCLRAFCMVRESLFPHGVGDQVSNAQKQAKGRTRTLWPWRIQAAKCFHTEENLEFQLFHPLPRPL